MRLHRSLAGLSALALVGLGLGAVRWASTSSTWGQDVVVTFLDLDGFKFDPAQAVARFGSRTAQPDELVYGSRLYRRVSERKLLVQWTTKGQAVEPIEVLLPEPLRGQTAWVTLQTDGSGRLKAERTKVHHQDRQRAVRRPRAGTRAVASPPPNDDCSAALPIALGNTAFTNLEATLDGPAHGACLVGGQVFSDVWYSFVAPANGLLTVSTCDQADYDTVLAAYDGTDCAALSFIDCNDDAPGCMGFTSELSFVVLQGDSYLIRVGGFDASQQGSGTLSLSLDTSAGPPPNDDCDAPLPITCNSSVTFDNTFATSDPSDPALACAFGGTAGEGTVWFEFVPDRRAALIETTRSAVEDTILALFEGSDCSNLRLVGCSDDVDPTRGEFRSKISISNLVKGRTYRILVSSFNAANQGEITLDVTCPAPEGRCCLPDGSCSNEIEVECQFENGLWDPTTRCNTAPCPQPPANDSCDTAIAVGLPATEFFDNVLADSDLAPGSECMLLTGPFKNVWYELVGTGNTITVSTCNAGTEIDTKIAVYCRDCGDLVCVDGNDDDSNCPFGPLSSTVSFASQAGSRYLVTVGSWERNSATGNVQVDFSDDGVPATGAVACEAVGACCLSAGLCIVGMEADCASMGGTFLGEGTTCQENLLADGGFELGPGSGAWIETSTNFGTPICDELCGDSGSPDPHFQGRYWAWFGGSQPGVPELGTLEQTVVVPRTRMTLLEFELEIPFASGNGVDSLVVLVDGAPVFTVLESDRPTYATYARVRVDLSAIGDGRPHVLRFEGAVTGVDGAGLPIATTNFFVDDVKLLVATSGCI